MIKYDWEKVQRLCNGQPNDIVWYLAFRSGAYTKTLHYLRNVNKSLYTAAKRPLPVGYSYIINTEDLFNNESGADITEIYEYITLASNRQIFDYRVRGDSTLHLNIALALGIDVTYNSLLTVTNNIINFKYEQKTTEARNGD